MSRWGGGGNTLLAHLPHVSSSIFFPLTICPLYLMGATTVFTSEPASRPASQTNRPSKRQTNRPRDRQALQNVTTPTPIIRCSLWPRPRPHPRPLALPAGLLEHHPTSKTSSPQSFHPICSTPPPYLPHSQSSLFQITKMHMHTHSGGFFSLLTWYSQWKVCSNWLMRSNTKDTIWSHSNWVIEYKLLLL